MAEAIRIPLDKVETAEGKQAMFRQLHGIPDREMDELIISWESGKGGKKGYFVKRL